MFGQNHLKRWASSLSIKMKLLIDLAFVSNIVLIIVSYNLLGIKASDYDKGGYVVGELVGETTSTLQDTKDLLKHIFSEYDTRLRPRVNQSESVNVTATFIPNAIVNFDTTGQKIDVIGFFRITWKDDITRWNATEFGDTDVIMVPLKDIWYPKLIIDKAYNGNGVIGDKNMDIVKIDDTGEVQWVPNGIFGFICDVDVQFYPYDIQRCDLDFYATDQTASNVKLMSPEEVTLDFFTENSEWRLLQVSSSIKTSYGTNIVSITFQIERRASFTVYTIVIPLFTLSLLSTFTFIVPVESGEKGGLSITIFLAYGFFIAITRDSLPHNSLQIPYFVSYICVLLILSVFTVLYVMVESKIYHTRGTRPCNLRIHSLLLLLPKPVKIGKLNQNTEQHKTNNPIKHAKKQVQKTINSRVKKNSANHTSVSIPENQTDIADGNEYTWTDFLRVTNIILFCVSFIFLFLFSAVLWTKVMDRKY